MRRSNIVPEYSARVMEVISGDDLVLMVDLGIDDLYKRVRARLQGVDTPDAYRKPDDEIAGRVRNEVRKLTKGKQCRIEVHAQGKGGWVVTLHIAQDESEFDLNAFLREKGYVFDQKNRKPHAEAPISGLQQTT